MSALMKTEACCGGSADDEYRRLVQGTTLGSLVVTLFIVILVDFFVYSTTNHYGNKLFAFILASELHLIGIVLLFDLEYNDHDHHDHDHTSRHDRGGKDYKPPIEDVQFLDGESSTISNITTQQSEGHPPPHLHHHHHHHHAANPKAQETHESDTDHSSYTTLASISTAFGSSKSSFEDDHERNRILPCFCGFSLSYAVFFSLVTILSSVIFLASLNEQLYMYGMDLSVAFGPSKEWARAVFLITFGFLLASSLLSYYKWLLEVSFDSSVLSREWFKHCLSIFLAVISMGILGRAFLVRQTAFEELQPFFYNGSNQPYWGEAWAKGGYIIDDDATCEHYEDYIPINVTIMYGDWACPNIPDQTCELIMTSKVECSFLNSFLAPDDVGDDEVAEEDDYADGNPNGYSLTDYIYFRYHEYNVDDDSDVNVDEMPFFNYWNRPTEPIIGSCDGTCTARSQDWASSQFQNFSQGNHTMYLNLGLGLCFLGWPLYECWRRRSSSA